MVEVELSGTPSDDVPAILEVGGADAELLVFGLTGPQPQGRDAEHIAWHTLDHRPEQFRIPGLRAATRLVSTPECRANRAASAGHYDAAAHATLYLFSPTAQLADFRALGRALWDAERFPLPSAPIEVGVYRAVGRASAPRVRVGADVLPWYPARGYYLILERAVMAPGDLVGLPGVAGAWWFRGEPSEVFSDGTGLMLTVVFLDVPPAETGATLRAALAERWQSDAAEPLLAAPFEAVVPHDWSRYLP
jgi:hypothetical protein